MICLNRAVLDFMAGVIRPSSAVVEFGAGGSTRWFAVRCARLVSVETSPEWARMARESCAGVRCRVEVRREAGELPVADLVLVDSVWRNRERDARAGFAALKRGGWLVLDDAQRERHAETVAWLTEACGAPVSLGWSKGDAETARERLALAWMKL